MVISQLKLEQAYSRVRNHVMNTPLVRIPFLEERWQCEVHIKCEQFQPIGAFKVRGASNFALQLSSEERERGFVTHSSGNHAQAVAYTASKMGVKAYVVMPENSNRQKIANAKKWGAKVSLCKPTFEDRLEQSNALATEHGSIIIPPFDHDWIVEGQATCAMEMLAEKTDFDAIITPLGGGGLLAGTALAAHYFNPKTKVIGAEPEEAADGYKGFLSGKRVESFTPNTIADGLRTTVGAVPFGYITKHVDEVILADEESIKMWVYRLWSETKFLMEVSSAVPFAAIDRQKEQFKGKSIGIIVTGGNVDWNQLP